MKGESLMLAGQVAKDTSWQHSAVKGGHRYTSAAGSVTILENPWLIEIRDAQGTLLTKTDHSEDNKTSFTPILPFSYVRRGGDYSRSFNAVFTLSPGEQIYGCAETFMGFDKRWQKVVLWTDDANGVQNETGFVCLPSDNKLHEVALNKSTGVLKLAADPFAGKVTWRLRAF